MVTRRAVLISSVAFALPASSHARKRKKPKARADAALPLVRDLARHHRHGWRDEGSPIPALVAQYRAGQEIECICGSISAVAASLLQAAGMPARVVGVLTRQPFVGDDGHIMLEVWDRGAWRLYDVDGNRRAVDSQGRGVSLITQVNAGSSRRWESIADDPQTAPDFVSTMPPDHPFYWTSAWDARIFGTPWIQRPDAWTVFHDPSDRERMEAQGHRYVDGKAWKALLGKP